MRSAVLRSLGAAFAVSIAVAACNAVSGVGSYTFDANDGFGGATTTATQAVTTTSSSNGGANPTFVGSGGAGGNGGGGADAGGTGGTSSACGDGVVDKTLGEECDDGNQVAGDGCTNCLLDCKHASNGTVDTTTNHCYWFVSSETTWSDARTVCKHAAPGADLASLGSTSEISIGKNLVDLRSAWLGGMRNDANSKFVWVDGETWSSTDDGAWSYGHPPNNTTKNCLALTQNGFFGQECSSVLAMLCELDLSTP